MKQICEGVHEIDRDEVIIMPLVPWQLPANTEPPMNGSTDLRAGGKYLIRGATYILNVSDVKFHIVRTGECLACMYIEDGRLSAALRENTTLRAEVAKLKEQISEKGSFW